MPYTHLLVAVAPTPESQVLIKKSGVDCPPR
ncbi:Universal stress protein C [Klebsiella pneumoniae]|uniref:Universal stress protein C n=1 Tax=Klebsiella pneumoniae TaxID=573 RepID=A0A2X3HKN1_KLEPN|nr:Universal stress protein C [Klebsiella pneumoniae]